MLKKLLKKLYVLKVVKEIEGPTNGKAFMFFITLEESAPSYVLEHEKEHVYQFWSTLGLHGLLYSFKWYRERAELKAFAESVRNGMKIDEAAEVLSKHYRLDKTKEEYVTLLIKEIYSKD